MGQFTKKPVTIEAVQWDGRTVGDVPDWILEALNKGPDVPGGIMRIGDTVHVFTTEGVMIASPTDWIIRGVEGELYPCKDSVFVATYSPASRQPDSKGDPALSLAETQAVVETKTAPRVTEASIKAKIAEVEYFRVRHLTICLIILQTGFFVTGESAPAAPENYDQQVGERYAYENAFRKLWPLEGYLLRELLAQREAEACGQDDAIQAA
ncbi:Gp49 family protein [Methylorubrum suomiense]|uniref:Phage protein n=1 Tax=Methylorubrum suomiense TaxID=144191 RepID=A0ABQ4V167_9HYPH|nr:Gp49 family protein [Methylorubrum suomiense]GJE77468.1 hypothetical protein BGCPKDLD_4073 [Methylorubrum suomiense]